MFIRFLEFNSYLPLLIPLLATRESGSNIAADQGVPLKSDIFNKGNTPAIAFSLYSMSLKHFLRDLSNQAKNIPTMQP